MPEYTPRIAIVGAGPAGLTLGRLLYLQGIPATIYERRPEPTAEDLAKPCGMLDLHAESGIAALRDCGLYDDFLGLVGACSEETRVVHRDGRLLHHDLGNHGDEARPEISRHDLSRLLRSSLPATAIRWNHKAVAVTPSATTARGGATEFTVDFGPSGRVSCDLVVGADGCWSRVRELLTSVRPRYSGVQMITLDIRDASSRHPRLAEFLGTGSLFSLGRGKAVLGQRAAHGGARIYLAVSTPDEQFGRTSGLAHMTAPQAKARLLGDAHLYADWGPVQREVIEAACDDDESGQLLHIRPLYMLPVGHSWETRVGATLVGDAAHLMPPWAGEGVNLAMWDCRDLAQAIAQAITEATAAAANAGDDAKPATADGARAAFHRALAPLQVQFERRMLERAAEKAQETMDNKRIMFDTEDGATAMADFFHSAFASRS